ncbi:MAG: transcriptional regulator, partial [Deltaproteobacteria bacterium]|nr:transcriptional regulator [Deltaproteobacteria bacterium]
MKPKSKNTTPPDELCSTNLVHQDVVERALSRAPTSQEIERLALTYKVLSDPTRLKMVFALAGGEMCVCDLAAFVDSTDSAVSHHLRRL